jgi:hypothetical protein
MILINLNAYNVLLIKFIYFQLEILFLRLSNNNINEIYNKIYLYALKKLITTSLFFFFLFP